MRCGARDLGRLGQLQQVVTCLGLSGDIPQLPGLQAAAPAFPSPRTTCTVFYDMELCFDENYF